MYGYNRLTTYSNEDPYVAMEYGTQPFEIYLINWDKIDYLKL